MIDQSLFLALKGRGMQGAPAQSQSDYVAPSAPAPGSPPGAGSSSNLFNALSVDPSMQVAEASPGGEEAEKSMRKVFGPMKPLPAPSPLPVQNPQVKA